MKASELRIGNWIMDRGNKVWQIDCWENPTKAAAECPKIGEFMGEPMFMHPYTEEVDFIKPIPLTEDWLLKFGFEKDFVKEIYRIKVNEYILEVSVNAFSGTLEKDNDWFFSVLTGFGSQPLTLVKLYVHQLQNFYFALTGKELTIKK